MRIINVIGIKDGVVDTIDSFGVFDETKVQEVVDKAQALFIEKAREIGLEGEIDEENDPIFDDGYYGIMNVCVCLSWSDVEEVSDIIKGTFVSVWDGGEEVRTPAELNTKTGEVTTESVDVEGLDLDILDREYFETSDGDELEVCTDCHEYILKTVMKEGIGKTLNEVHVCSNPDCDNQ
jgi:hypothetical protein